MPNILEIGITKLSQEHNEQVLLDFIQWIDNEFCEDINIHGPAQQIITRSIIAIGNYYLKHKARDEEVIQLITATVDAANKYVLFPNNDNLDAYHELASISYPFGSGEGCYSVTALIEDSPCGPGTGCSSGIGSIASMQLDSETILAVISADLLPWLKAEKDPVLARVEV